MNALSREDSGRLRPSAVGGNRGSGFELRMERLFSHADGRSLILGVDHPLFEGHVSGLENIPLLLSTLPENALDGLLVSPATMQAVSSMKRLAKCHAMRLDTTGAFRQHGGSDIEATLVASADDIARSGADVVACFFLVNAAGHRRVADHRSHLAQIAAMCRRIGYPVMVEALAVDDDGNTVRETSQILHAARLAAELGADLLKIDAPHDIADLGDVVGAVDRPVFIRGGTPKDKVTDTLRDVEAYVARGATGLVIGRSIFQAAQPAELLKSLHRVVHGG